MIDILIVDDETIVRKGIQSLIDWESKGLRVVGEASNGMEGMIKALELRPQIIITDIRMPIMDGLEFAAKIRKNLPYTRVVLLSGYDDFSYARKAIQVGVSEYLLKPVGETELVGLMEKLKEEILQDQQSQSDKISADIIFNQNLPGMQSKLMMQIVKGEFNDYEENLRTKAEMLRVELGGPKYQIVLISIDDYLRLTESYTEKDRDLLKYSVKNISEELLKTVSDATVCYGEFDHLVALLSVKNEDQEKLVNSCKEIQFFIEKYLSLTVTIGLGRVYGDAKMIPKSYSEAIEAIQSKIIRGKNKIIMADDVQHTGDAAVTSLFTPADCKEIVGCMDMLDETKLDCTLNRLFSRLHHSEVDYHQIKKQCVELVFSIFTQMDTVGFNIKKAGVGQSVPYKEIEKYETVDDIKDWLRLTLFQVMESMESSACAKYKGIVRKAIQYIQEHYNEDLNIGDVANAVYVSPNYLSSVFKDEVGENYINWLNKYRIEKAKMLLKNDNGSKIYEIAEKVGFNDYKYFVMIFKRHTSITPKEYREKLL